MSNIFFNTMRNLLICCFLLIATNIYANESLIFSEDKDQKNNNNNDLIKVFLDCSGCDIHYIRENITFVNYVRDKELAEVHILVTSHRAGVSGTSYIISFIGMGEFEGMDNEINLWVSRGDTQGEIRSRMVERLKLGLSPYIANTGIADMLVVKMLDYEQFESNDIEDPWNNWVFEVYAGANLSKEERQRSFSARYGFFADKISEEWKIRARTYFNYSDRYFETDDGTVRSVSHRDGFQGYIIKSIDDHWSAGLFSNMLSSTFHNMDFKVDITPGIEYSIFPYEEATRRSITFAYKLGYSYNNYIEKTIFEKEKENLVGHEIEASVRFRQTWGSFRTGLSGSQHFHDFNSNRAEFFTRLNFRIFKGFSLSLAGNLDLINDMVALPMGDSSVEEILLEQRQRATDYQMNGSIGITYSFGSDFANVVNTRF